LKQRLLFNVTLVYSSDKFINKELGKIGSVQYPLNVFDWRCMFVFCFSFPGSTRLNVAHSGSDFAYGMGERLRRRLWQLYQNHCQIDERFEELFERSVFRLLVGYVCECHQFEFCRFCFQLTAFCFKGFEELH
jgi:hypothetical protein